MNKETRKNSIILVIALSALIFVLTISSLAYSLGFNVGHNKPKEIVIEGVLNAETQTKEPIDFNLFWEAWELLERKHVDSEEFTSQDMLEGAIKGLAGTFNDPYTTFFDKEDSIKFTEDIQGNFGGVGMEIGIRNEKITVVAPLENTPAERAGLKAQDVILEIDGESTADLSVEEAVKLIRGDIGTVVILTIFREEWSESREFEITRANIQIPTLDLEFKEGNIAYIKLHSFNQSTNKLFYEALKKMDSNDSRGLVLDLRNNPGGYLQVAIDMAAWFLEKDAVVLTQRFSSGEEDVFKAGGNRGLENFPVVILINRGSASASEILAGALRDTRGIKLVGEQSFGKGTVQDLTTLSNGSTLKITTAKWILPSGTEIDQEGLTPDYEVEFPDDWERGDPDPQLEKALEVLKEEL